MQPASMTIIGASGQQGLAQVELASGRGLAVTAIGHKRLERARNIYPQRQGLRWQGADLSDPASLRSAIKEGTTLLVNMPSSSFNPDTVLFAQFDNLLSVAKDRARKLVFNTSMFVPAGRSGFKALDVRREMISRLQKSDIPYVVVKPVIYMDNLLAGWAYPKLLEENVFYYPHRPDLEVSWICLRDVAQVMLAVALSHEFNGTELTIGGPETLTGDKVAQNLSAAWGRPIRFETMPISVFAQQMATLFAARNNYDAEKLVAELTRVYSWYNTADIKPFKVEMTALAQRLGVTLTPMKEWAAHVKRDASNAL